MMHGCMVCIPLEQIAELSSELGWVARFFLFVIRDGGFAFFVWKYIYQCVSDTGGVQVTRLDDVISALRLHLSLQG
jgi:hypothetical protein